MCQMRSFWGSREGKRLAGILFDVCKSGLKWHKCSLPWDKPDLAEDLALFIHEAINKLQAGQQTCCAKPQEGCFARCWALLPSLKSPGRVGWTGKALWSWLCGVGMCWGVVGIPAAVVGRRETAYLLCVQSDLQSFSRLITPGGKKISWITWGWEEVQEGARAACCWLGQCYFSHSHRTPCCVIAKFLTRSISYLYSLLSAWLPLEVPSRDGGKLFRVLFYTLQLWGQPGPRSFQEPSHAPASVRVVAPLAAGLSVPLTPQHTKRRWYSGMASGLVALFMGKKLLWFQATWVSSGWVSGISLGCPHR